MPHRGLKVDHLRLGPESAVPEAIKQASPLLMFATLGVAGLGDSYSFALGKLLRILAEENLYCLSSIFNYARVQQNRPHHRRLRRHWL
jgi:hypothetical protein